MRYFLFYMYQINYCFNFRRWIIFYIITRYKYIIFNFSHIKLVCKILKTYIVLTHTDDDSVLIDKAEENSIATKQSKTNEETIKGNVNTLYLNSLYIRFQCI